MPEPKNILDALRAIIDPDFQRSIVDLGFVKNIQIDQGRVSFDIALTTPACPVKAEFERQARDAVRKLPGVKEVHVHMTTLPMARHSPPGAAEGQTPSALESVQSIIAVSSCKGGVGKSTLAAHLAQELAQRGFKTGLVDTDIHGPSVPSLFNLHNVEIYSDAQRRLIPVEKNNLKLMSFGFLLGDAPAVMRGPMVARYVQQILHGTIWGELDYLIVDMPPGTGDVQLTITQTVRLSGAVIVTTPQTLSLIDVARGILMFERVNVPILGVIENMAYFICGQCGKRHDIFGRQGGAALREKFGVDILAELPILSQLTMNLDPPVSNSYIQEATDQLARAVGKQRLQQRSIPQISFDHQSITVRFENESPRVLSNRILRMNCRCALCVNEITGEQILREKDIRADIAPKDIIPLGNYAVGIAWNDGHSSGIYPYTLIKNLLR